MTQRDDMGREVGGGFRIGNSCIPVMDSCQCMAKPIQYCKVKEKLKKKKEFSSVQFSRSVVSDSLRPHESQHTRSPCPSPTPRVYPNSCPLSRFCHPAMSSSVVPFSSCLQSFPASGSFQMSQHFTSGGQSIGVSASVLFLPVNTRTDLL